MGELNNPDITTLQKADSPNGETAPSGRADLRPENIHDATGSMRAPSPMRRATAMISPK
jgi:hypothetical protein